MQIRPILCSLTVVLLLIPSETRSGQTGFDVQLDQLFSPDLGSNNAKKDDYNNHSFFRIIGEDERSYLKTHSQDGIDFRTFVAVGKVYCKDPADSKLNTWSTATLVDNQSTVFTVGHFRTHHTGHIFPISQCRFYLYNPEGTRTKSYGLDARRVTAAHDPIEYSKNPKAGVEDWAVIGLSEDVDLGLAKAIRVKAAELSQLPRFNKSFMVSYHGQRSGRSQHRRVVSLNCQPRRHLNFSRFFDHSCDTFRGSSGGLIFVREGDEFVGVAYSHMESLPTDPETNYGQFITPQILSLIRKAPDTRLQ